MPHTKPLGTFCTIGSYDTDEEIEPFDVIRTSAGTCYRVVEARRVGPRSKHYPYRWHLYCVRIASEDVEDKDKIHPLHWYKRNKTRI